MEPFKTSLLITLQIFLVLLAPFLHIRFGRVFIATLHRIRPNSKFNPSLSEIYFPGLLIFLIGIFILKCIGLHWLTTILIVYLPLILKPTDVKETLSAFSINKLSLNFCLWFFIIFGIGITFVNSTESIQTIWINTYGDLAFHTGMISSFALGENFPPQNQGMAGVSLTYPFFVNLWTASLWWPSANITSFGLILIYQWMTVWTVIFYLLNGNKFHILPWALLLGGGSYFVLGTHSGENIPKGYPWSVFITTIWIPQRSALLGALGAITVLNQFHKFLNNRSEDLRLIYATLILAFMPLVHTHIFLILSLYIGIALTFELFHKNAKPLATFILFMVPSFLSLPFLLGKESILRFAYGWMPWKEINSVLITSKFNGAMQMWIHNAPQWFLLFVALWIITRRHALFLPILLLFIAGNFVQFAVWEWDQIKIFVSLYIIFISLWLIEDKTNKLKYFHYSLILLTIPGIFELNKVLTQFRKVTIYSIKDLEYAKGIISTTPEDAIFLASPNHNSPITLTGRKLFMGFPGTLYSHGLSYKDREEMMKSLSTALRCSAHEQYRNARPKICPEYLLWGQNEISKWGQLNQDHRSLLRPTKYNYIYKIGTEPNLNRQ